MTEPAEFIKEGRAQYRNGTPARVLCTDAPHKPVVAMTLDTASMLTRHNATGARLGVMGDEWDLVEIPPPPAEPREWDIFVNPEGYLQTDALSDGSTLLRGVTRIRVREVQPGQATSDPATPDAGEHGPKADRNLRVYLENILVTARCITGIRWGHDGDGGADVAAHSIIELTEACLAIIKTDATGAPLNPQPSTGES
jgi:hypothetical protein